MKTKTHILSVGPYFFLIGECMMAGKRCLISNEKKKKKMKKPNVFTPGKK